ncbi:hypothetical protein LCGC14_2224430, partial [marine sediment metagenome]
MPIGGVIADKMNKKTLILVADSSQAFATFLLILFFQFGVANIYLVYVFISIRSIFQAFHIPAVNAIIPSMVPQDKLTRINGINFLFTGVVQFISSFMGALFLMFLPMNLVLWIDFITFFIALLPLIRITIPSVGKQNHSKDEERKISFFKEFRLGFKTLKLVPGLIIMIVLSMFLNFIIQPANILMPLYVIDHGGAAGHLAMVEMTFTGGMIGGALFTSVKKKWGNKIRVIFVCLLFALVGYIIFAITPTGNFIIMGIGGIILGFNLPIIN